MKRSLPTRLAPTFPNALTLIVSSEGRRLIAAEFTIPFRFQRREAKRLLQVAQYLASEKAPGERTEDVGLLVNAAKAADSGEPMMVVVAGAEEVEQMADAFVRLGFSRPAIG